MIWAALLEAWRAWMETSGVQTVTIRRRMQRMRRAATTFADADPWTLTSEQLAAWLAMHEEWTSSTRLSYRDALRSFYAWAATTGRTETDPAAGLTPAGVVALEPAARPADAWTPHLEAWERWLVASDRPSTTIELRLYQLSRLADAFTDRDPWSLTVDDLATWLAQRKWSGETRRSYRTALRIFYGWALATGRTSHDPAALLPSINPRRGVPRPAPETVVGDALSTSDERVYVMLMLATYAGLRRGEIAAVHSNDLQRHGEGWALVVHGKGRRQRLVPLIPAVAAELRRLPEGYAFPGRENGHLSPPYVGKLISRALAEGYTAHTLRHRFASQAYRGTRDLRAVQQLLGHSKPETTALYVQVPDDTLLAAVNAAAAGRTLVPV